MCLRNKKDCAITTIKILGILLLSNLLLTVLGIEYAPLYWIANFTYDSLPLVQGTELTNSNIEKWGIRGQIGDIMSGHFSALAVLAVAYSITLQVEANKKMTESIEKQEEALRHTEETILQQKLSIEKQTEANIEQAKNTLQQAKAIELQAKSIEQQNEALKVQSETLKAQIEELTASREESERQTEEFFIQNMNVRLDRYYKLLDESIKPILNEDYLKFIILNSNKDYQSLDEKYKITLSNGKLKIAKIIYVVELINDAIDSIENDNTKEIFYNEFFMKLFTSAQLHKLYGNYTAVSNNKIFQKVFEEVKSSLSKK